MKCGNARSLMHEFLDRELAGLKEAEIEEHLDECTPCQEYFDEFRFVKRALAAHVQLPAASRHLLWARIHARRQRSLLGWLAARFDAFSTYWRDLDGRILWSRISAVPVSVACFALLFFTMAPPRPQLQQFAALTQLRPFTPMITVIEAQQDPRTLQHIYDELEQAVLETGSDDEAALILDIDPFEKRVEVEDIREYPKSQKLLEALVRSLRASRFEPSPEPRRIVHLFNSVEVQDSAPQKGM